MQPSRYHPGLVALHWLVAILVLFSLGMGMLVLEEIPNSSPDKIDALRGHMIAGIVILLLMLIRLALRLKTKRPAPATTGNAVLDRLALITHWGFYLLVLLMAASGIATSVQAGLPAIVFGGSGAPLPESFSIYVPRMVHGATAGVLLGLVILHAGAALYHQFVRRDNLLSRMWFGKRWFDR
jgi:cytochrome b561